MGRFLAGLAAILAFVVGFDAQTASAAAACEDIECPYTGCVSTSTSIKAPDRIRRGNAATVKVRVTPTSGNATVTGSIRVRFEHRRTGRTKSVRADYRGNDYEAVRGPSLGRLGRWNVTARFCSDFRFPSSSDSTTLRVVRAA